MNFYVNNFDGIRIQKIPDFSGLYLADYDIFYLVFYRPFLTCRKYEYPNGIRFPISTAARKL